VGLSELNSVYGYLVSPILRYVKMQHGLGGGNFVDPIYRYVKTRVLTYLRMESAKYPEMLFDSGKPTLFHNPEGSRHQFYHCESLKHYIMCTSLEKVR
jgi:hypothetical protein